MQGTSVTLKIRDGYIFSKAKRESRKFLRKVKTEREVLNGYKALGRQFL